MPRTTLANADPYTSVLASSSPVLLLDVGGVIFRSAWELLADYERWSGLPAGSLPWRGKFDPDHDDAWRDYLSGATTERVYWQRFSANCQMAGARLDSFTSVMAAIHMGGYTDIARPEVRSLISATQDQGRPYGIFTNDLVHLFGSDWPMSFPEIANAAWFIDATATGFLKPESGAYEAAIRLLDIPPQQIVFVDDDHLNIDAANKAGMTGILLDVTNPQSALDQARRALGL